MAAPVISGNLNISTVVNVSVHYQIRASNVPTSYTASGTPDALTFSTSLGQFQGKITTAGVYPVAIGAVNADGTGTATLTITATDSGVGGGGSTGVSVYQAKFWTDLSETIDYADLDATGNPICSFDPGVITSTQLSATALGHKVTAIGKPGFIGKYTFATDFVFPVPVLRGRYKFATVAMPGVSPGDIVVIGEPRSTFNIYAGFPCIGVADTNAVNLYAYTEAGGGTIFAGAFVTFRVFLF